MLNGMDVVFQACSDQLQQWCQLYEEICCGDREAAVSEFRSPEPSNWDWDLKLMHFNQLQVAESLVSSLVDFVDCRHPN